MTADADRVARQIRASEKQISAFVATLDSFLGREIARVLLELKRDPEAVQENLAVLATLQPALERAGLKDQFQSLFEVYDEQLIQIREAYAELGFENVFAGLNTTAIETMVSLDVSAVSGRTDQLLGDLKKELVRSIVTGSKPFGKELENFSGRLRRQLEADVNTAVSSFHRTVTIQKADEVGLDKFIYLGPLDVVTRPFCRARVGKAFTRVEIERQNNGQGLPVLQYGGGYNCRHQYRPISDERFEELRGKAKAEQVLDAGSKPEEATEPTPKPQARPKKAGDWRDSATEIEGEFITTSERDRDRMENDFAPIREKSKDWGRQAKDEALGDTNSLVKFTGDDYPHIRDALSNKKTESPYFQMGIEAMRAARTAPVFEGMAYRGMKFRTDEARDEAVNKIVADGGYAERGLSSFSRDPRVAKDDFALYDTKSVRSVYIEAEVERLRSIEYVASLPREREVLSVRGDRFELIETLHDAKNNVVILRMRQRARQRKG